MSVKYIRKEVRGKVPVWDLIDLVLAGPRAVKQAGDKLLPRPNASDTSTENKARYDSYLKRAVFYAVTRRTHIGLLGQIFYRDSVIELPPAIAILNDSVDGGALTLDQQSKEACSLVLAKGHGGLLTDYPKTEKPATKAELAAGRVRPKILMYLPHNIINWETSVVGGENKLTLLVLKETYHGKIDEFEAEEKTQYRVLSLDDTGYRVRIFREEDGAERVVEDFYPRAGNGATWKEIPFSFMGATNNDPIPDDAPLEDMTHLNIGHYRNSADYEEACFIIGQPTPWASGLTQDWVEEVWKGEVLLGSRAFLPLPVGGSAGLLQVAPNTMTKEAMEHKERQMVAMGARLVEQQQVQRTATETSLESISDNSVLANVAKNVSAAYMKALEYAMVFANGSGNITFELNTDFELNKLSSQERQQLLVEWQGGGLTWEEYRWNLKRSGVAFEDDEKAKGKIDAESDNDLDLDDDRATEEDPEA